MLCFSNIKTLLPCSYILVFNQGLICGKPPPINEVDNSRVIGGQNAASRTWKWQVDNESISQIITNNYPFRVFFCLNHIDSIFIKEIYYICRKHELLPPVVLFQPFQVSLQMDSYNEGYFSHICGGSILNSYHIMTAAHCILRSDYPSVFISSHFLSLFIGSDCTE